MSRQLRSPQGLEGIFNISGDRISAWQPVISCPVKDLFIWYDGKTQVNFTAIFR
ncbi:MAG: hypothetical protein RM021_008415 [Nostoc sp. EkiNYC01]|nr:hypothetical protein [Nostoc sp. EkiNYC01]